MFEHMQSRSYELVQLRHALLLREVERNRRDREQAAALMVERKALRRFQVMYRVRHWLYRMAPRMARTIA